MELSNETKKELLASCTKAELTAALGVGAFDDATKAIKGIGGSLLGLRDAGRIQVQFTHGALDKALTSTYYSKSDLHMLAEKLLEVCAVME